MISCLYCGANDFTPLYEAADFNDKQILYVLTQCCRCGSVITSPIPTDDELSRVYDDSYYGTAQSKFIPVIEIWTQFAARRRARRLLVQHRSANQPLRILDIGCGRGVLLDVFASLGHNVLGVERRGSPFEGGNNVVCGELDALNLEKESFDIIVIWHVFEHLTSPGGMLNAISQLLKPSGSLFVSVPNFGSFQSRIFKGHWFHLDLPRHISHLNQASVAYMLGKVNLKIVEQHTIAFDQSIYGFVQSVLNMLPFIPNNHLYKQLKAGMSKKTLYTIIAYSPVLIILLCFSLLEFLSSRLAGNGASLTIKAKKI